MEVHFRDPKTLKPTNLIHLIIESLSNRKQKTQETAKTTIFIHLFRTSKDVSNFQTFGEGNE